MIYNMSYYLFFGFSSLFVYYNRRKIPYFMNDVYLKVTHLKNNLLKNEGFSKEVKCNKVDSIYAVTYYYCNDKYLTLVNSNEDLQYPPYTPDEINEFKKGPSLHKMITSKNDIIGAELIYSYNNIECSIDILDLIQQLCGPLVNFYENTPNEIKKEHIIIFFKNLLWNKYKKDDQYSEYSTKLKHINIMTCDGNEFDLLNKFDN